MRPIFTRYLRSQLLLIVMSLLPASSFSSEPSSCARMYERLAALDPSLPGVLEETLKIDPALVRGEVTPRWSDFDRLSRILSTLRSAKRAVRESGREEDLANAVRGIQESLADEPALVALRDAAESRTPQGSYLPGEYALKRQYQHLLWELNRELPAGLKIRGVKIPLDTRKPRLIEDAKKLVSRQKKLFAKVYSETGFRDETAIRKAIRGSGREARQLLQDLDQGNVEFAMNRPESGRWWIPRVGFQNQRTTGSSKGILNVQTRNRVEAEMSGHDIKEFETFDNELKPNYGYLKPRPESSLEQSTAADAYGDDVYVFRKESVQDRLTWTAGDSLGLGKDLWKRYFVPWRHRALMVPDLLFGVREARVGFGVGLDVMIPSPLERRLAELPFPAEPTHLRPKIPPAPEPPKLEYPPAPKEPIKPSLKVHRKVPAPPRGVIAFPMEPIERRRGESLPDFLNRVKNSTEFKAYRARQERADQMNKKLYGESPEYREYQAETYALTEADRKFEASEEYQEYLRRNQAYQEEVAKLQREYYESDAYRSYREVQEKHSELVERLTKEYQKSDAFKRYQELVYQYHEQRQRIEAEFAKTPEGQAHQRRTSELKALRSAVRSIPGVRGELLGTPLARFQGQRGSDYIELQYWGPMTLDDVEIFEFRKNPPSGEFLEELLKRGIKIRDGRKPPAKLWVPSAVESSR